MDYKITDKLNIENNTCFITGFLSDDKDNFIAGIDDKYKNIISKLIDKLPQSTSYIYQGEYENHSILIFNLGKLQEYNLTSLVQQIKKIVNKLLEYKVQKAVISLPLIKNLAPNLQLKNMVLGIEETTYQFLDYKSKKERYELESITFALKDADKSSIDEALYISEGLKLTKNLANMPANICTPTYLAETAISLAKDFNLIEAKITDPTQMLKLGMNALLAVAQGSKEPAQLIELHYKGGSNDAQPIVLVGKGITFDSGGISIKPAEFMNEMKYDMSGAATVFGVIKACALLKLPINVIGIIPSAENMPSGNAVKPGDIVTTMAGLTVEITNTDAEGRLILADALTYAKKFSPKFVIDIATLTGAMIISLGRVMTGFMTNDDELADMLVKAQNDSLDKAWRLPLDDEYKEALDSPIADINNCASDRAAGSITAAEFLLNFTKDFRWAHLDIAGTAWVSGKNNRATGRPVTLLTQFIQNMTK